MKKIIFLDIDGPLAWGTWMGGRVNINSNLTIPYPWNQEDCDALKSILKETNAKIVLSSDWRKHYSFKDMGDILDFYGIDRDYLLDYTSMSEPKVKMSSSSEMDRANQIIKWLKANKIKKNWVAIDDLKLSDGFGYFKYPKYRHIQVDGDWGYGGKLRDKVEKIINVLNK